MQFIKRIKAAFRVIKYKFLYGLVLSVITASNMIPRRVWLGVCGILGNLLFYMMPGMRLQIHKNLTNAFKNEKSKHEILNLTRNVIIMFIKNAGIVLRQFLVTSHGFHKQSIVRGIEHAEEAFRRGRGVIFLTAHIGPFECLAHELSLSGYRPYIIGTPLKDPDLNELVNTNRTKFGAVVIERGKQTYRVMKNILAGGTMAILIDQDTSVKSVFVNFFGKPCSTPIGAALIARKTRAAVVPVFSHLNKRGQHEIEYYRELTLQRTGNETEDITVNTQKLTTTIENEIRKFPEQWVWMHRRWKTLQNISSMLPSSE